MSIPGSGIVAFLTEGITVAKPCPWMNGSLAGSTCHRTPIDENPSRDTRMLALLLKETCTIPLPLGNLVGLTRTHRTGPGESAQCVHAWDTSEPPPRRFAPQRRDRCRPHVLSNGGDDMRLLGSDGSLRPGRGPGLGRRFLGSNQPHLPRMPWSTWHGSGRSPSIPIPCLSLPKLFRHPALSFNRTAS
jgi:hypothetical protein